MLSVAANPARRFSPGESVAVLLPLPLAGCYDYVCGDESLGEGDFVEVPLGRRLQTGVVWGPGSGAVAAARLRPVGRRLRRPPLPEVSRRFVDWVAGYTLAAAGAVLRMVISVPAALEPPAPSWGLRPAPLPPGLRLTPGRRQVLAVAADGPPRATTDLARDAGVGAAVVQALLRAGALTQVAMTPPPLFPAPVIDHAGPALSAAQAAAAGQLRQSLDAGFSVAVIDGVTGSGKTEVYFEAIAACVAAGRQVVVLLPEIALSSQWLTRFRDRFGVAPAQWHSELSDARRRDTWRAVADGNAAVVVGARSALFLPFAHLGLIIVDEEHDGAFKQEDGVCYHARDMAVVRARLGGIVAVLASATPSLETLANIQAGRYRRLHLPDRHGGARMPEAVLVDLRRDPPPRGFWLSPVLVKAVEDALAAGEQAMLFLNRRGYAPLTLCRACGHRLQCPHCSAWLVEHRHSSRLVCHHCGHQVRVSRDCPECGATDSMVACGPGIERVAEEATHRFPAARIGVMASDTMGGPHAAADFVARIAAHDIDLIVGTQIVAKGYHFPLLTLVGVVDADLGLEGGDLRAGERTHQLLSQVAGRAGRAERPGRVLLQTFQPDHPVMQALAEGGRDEFIAAEARARQAAGMPPYGRLAALIVSGPEPGPLDDFVRQMARCAPNLEGFQIIGPAPAPLALLRGRHRRRFLVKARRDGAFHAPLKEWLKSLRPGHGIRVQIDIDPYSFL